MNSFSQELRILVGIVIKCQVGVAICVTLLACSGDVLKSGGENEIVHIPLESGSTWSYARFDSLAVVEDTVIVNVLEQVISIHGDIGIDIEIIDTLVSKLLAVTVNDTLFFVNDLEPPNTVYVRFVLPLKVGNSWLGSNLLDSMWVAGRETVEVPAGVFHNAFRVEQQFWFFNQSNQTTYWIAPGVGIVKKNIHNFGFSENKIESWNLLSYSIPE